MNKPCKRMLVVSIGVDYEGNEHKASNGGKDCLDIPGHCGCTHAEINMLDGMKHPEFVYLTHSPCINCAFALYRAGVKGVYYLNPYRLRDGIDFLKHHHIQVNQIIEPNLRKQWKEKLNENLSTERI